MLNEKERNKLELYLKLHGFTFPMPCLDCKYSMPCDIPNSHVECDAPKEMQNPVGCNNYHQWRVNNWKVLIGLNVR